MELKPILELGNAIGFTENLEQLGDLLVDKISLIFRAKKVSLMLLDKEEKQLFVWAASAMTEELKQVKVEYGQMFAGWVAKEGKPLLVKNVDSEFPHLSKVKLGRYQGKSFLIAPIKSRDKTLGVVNIAERQNIDIFSEEDLELISLINTWVALQMERIRLSEQIENLSIIDSLTGLFNHRYFHEQLSEEIYRAQRYRRPLSLVMFDIDNFAYYNRTYGHAAGDNVLRQISNILKKDMRQADIAGRYGGEEFAVILPDTPLKEAVFVGERIRGKIASAIFTDDSQRKSSLGMTRLTVSVGVTTYRIGLEREELIRRLLSALLEAKQKGKNCVCVFK